MVTFIANAVFIIFILACVYFIVVYFIDLSMKCQDEVDLNGMSERQERNDDYNTDYYI